MENGNDPEVLEEIGVEKKPAKRNDFLAVIILLAGLLAGSVFVDVAQLVSGAGFSQRRFAMPTCLNRTEKRG